MVAVYGSERHSSFSQCDSLMFYQTVACMLNEFIIYQVFPEHMTHSSLGNAKHNILLHLMVQMGISITFKATEIHMFATAGQKETKLSCQ